MKINSPQLGTHRATTRRIVLALLVAILSAAPIIAEPPNSSKVLTDSSGAIYRGNPGRKQIALVFTGDEFGESTAPILDTLAARKIKASLFVTGNFLRQPKLRELLDRAITEQHYVGPHSDSHPLYCSWDDREKSLVTEQFFKADLKKNIDDLQSLGALGNGSHAYFIPPYEWYNRDQVRWAKDLDVRLVNFTPGSGSNRDYARENDSRFVSSRKIYDDILAYERKAPAGLNGFLLLMHLGSGRRDPFHPHLGRLCDKLASRGYRFVRVDELLADIHAR